MREAMADDKKQLLELIARLADTVEILAKESHLSAHVLTRICNIRHDTLVMLRGGRWGRDS
jgi:hypothetical protein